MKLNALVAASLLILGTGAAASSAPLRPLVRGWERYFKLDWEAGMRGDRPAVTGHIFNDGGFAATRIRLLVETLDASGQVVSQTEDWLPGMLTPGMRAFFEVPVPQRAAEYRVSVFAFEWLPRGKGVL